MESLRLEDLHKTYRRGRVAIPVLNEADSIGDVVAGHIDATMATIPVAKSLIDAGQIKGLVVTSPQRSPVLPDVPTLKELAVRTADVDLQFWWGLFGPAGMPADVKDKLGNAVSTIIFMFSLVTIVLWYRLRMRTEGSAEVGLESLTTKDTK